MTYRMRPSLRFATHRVCRARAQPSSRLRCNTLPATDTPAALAERGQTHRARGKLQRISAVSENARLPLLALLLLLRTHGLPLGPLRLSLCALFRRLHAPFYEERIKLGLPRILRRVVTGRSGWRRSNSLLLLRWRRRGLRRDTRNVGRRERVGERRLSLLFWL